MNFHSEKGQSMVEYLLLLAVAVSIVVTFYNSSFFQSLFGQNGSVSQSVKSANEWGYRHGFYTPRTQGTPEVYQSVESHPSYYNHNKGKGRFFGPNDVYPQ